MRRVLLKSQQNEVLELIKKTNLEPFNFRWSVVNSRKPLALQVSQLNYLDTGFFFRFDFLEARHFAEFSPGEEKLVDEHYPESWRTQLGHFSHWLSYLEREMGQPDLWEQISKYQTDEVPKLPPDAANEPFTAKQVEQIHGMLDGVRDYLESQIGLNKEQLEFVNEKLDYLADAAKRQGRRDWLNTCIGVVVTISTALALAPEEAQTIFNMIKAALKGVIQLLAQ